MDAAEVLVVAAVLVVIDGWCARPALRCCACGYIMLWLLLLLLRFEGVYHSPRSFGACLPAGSRFFFSFSFLLSTGLAKTWYTAYLWLLRRLSLSTSWKRRGSWALTLTRSRRLGNRMGRWMRRW